MQQKSKSPPGEGKKKNRKIIFLILALLAVIVILLVILLLPKKEEEKKDQRETVVTKENVDKVKKQLQEPVEDGYYKTKMSIDWTFENGDAASFDAYVANSEDNTRTVYFDLNLADSGELVYSSPYMPVGTELTDIKLDKSLSAGDYECIMTYHLVDDDNKELTTLAVTINLHILN